MSFVVFERRYDPTRRNHIFRVGLVGSREMKVPEDHDIQADVMGKTIESAALQSLSHDINEQIINSLSQLKEDLRGTLPCVPHLEKTPARDAIRQVDNLINLLSTGIYLLQPEKILNGD